MVCAAVRTGCRSEGSYSMKSSLLFVKGAEAPESRSHIELTLDRHSAQFVKEILCSHFKTSRTPKFTLYILQTSAKSVLVLHDPLLPSLDKGSNTIEELALIVLNEEKVYFSSSEEPQSRASSRPSLKSAG